MKESNRSLIILADHHTLRSRTNRRDRIKKTKAWTCRLSNRIPPELSKDIPGPAWVLNQGLFIVSFTLSSYWSVSISSTIFLSAIDESTLQEILPLDFLLGSQRETTPAPPVGSGDRSVLHMAFIFIFCFFRHSRFSLTIIVSKGGISRDLTV